MKDFNKYFNKGTKLEKIKWGQKIIKKCNTTFNMLAHWRYAEHVNPDEVQQEIISKIMNTPVNELFPTKEKSK